MLIVSNIKININDEFDVAIQKAKRKIKAKSGDIKSAFISKVSVDARHQRDKGEISLICSVGFELNSDEQKFMQKLNDKDVKLKLKTKIEYKVGEGKLTSRPVIVGFGPAGMFAGLILSENGYNPIVIERGADIDKRVADVEGFWQNAVLDVNSNVQFGEGGAGTFSDGKLTTRIGDSYCDYVLDTFHKFGAPDEIKTKAKPHIGTDKLRDVVKNIRKQIIKNGGEVRFCERLTDIVAQNGKLTAIKTSNDELSADVLVLAIGHSARDTFNLLRDKQILMQSKPFSVGVRIEHLQSEINRGLYGELAGHPNLPQGEYQLSHREDERAVYTFCMCPGGMVVPCSSEPNMVVTNGMSEYSRGEKNANSALVVSVDSRDFGNDIFSGVEFQRTLEKSAYIAGGSNYKAPAQDVKGFIEGKKSLVIKDVCPSYAIGTTPADFNEILPSQVCDMMKLGLARFDRKIKGFASPTAILTGVETRTSSPVRIMRNEECVSPSIEGLYPCGEGAGYAGGIMSAAVDGIKIAIKIMEKYKPF
ncbi:MAG: hypothetical protein IJC83_06460 [Oscillospiraceae bacterium]|nr:hypothetical protein [Oscillospiraceae bacterium]